MEQVKSSGKAKSIGVSKIGRKDLELIHNGDLKELPAVNQLEYHLLPSLFGPTQVMSDHNKRVYSSKTTFLCLWQQAPTLHAKHQVSIHHLRFAMFDSVTTLHCPKYVNPET